MTSLPLNSVVAYADFISDSTLHVKGYALPGPTGNVKTVDLTLDDGQTWQAAKILYQGGKWSWTIWEAEIECSLDSGTVHSRATDTAGHAQPKTGIWNLRGVAYNGWGVNTFTR